QTRVQLEREQQASERAHQLVASAADLATHQSRRAAAVALARMVVAQTPATAAAAYILTGERSRQLMRAGSVGDIADGPSFCEEMELLTYASDANYRVVRLSLGSVHQGFLILDSGDVESLPLWDLFVAQATTGLALIGEREQSHRGAMKAPHSSAYTFAYFVDVAGREIDKAVRHSRRFALATVTLKTEAEGGQ